MSKEQLINELYGILRESKELEFYQIIKDSEVCNLPVELRKTNAQEVITKINSVGMSETRVLNVLKLLLAGNSVSVDNDTEFIVGADIEKTKRGIRRLKKELEKWSKK